MTAFAASSRVSKNIVFNYLGKLWSVVSIYAFVPLYVRWLGVEQYGIVAFYSVLAGSVAFANFGLTATLNRELARLSGEDAAPRQMCEMTRTFEAVFAFIAIAIFGLVFIAAPGISRTWIHSEALDTREVSEAVRLMALAIALRFPADLYLGALLGLQRQGISNLVFALAGVLRVLLTLLALEFVAPTARVFFCCLGVVAILEVLVARAMLWRALPTHVHRGRPSLSVLRSVWRYSLGMAVISALSIVISQIDKVVVSGLMTLDALAVYSLATLISRAPVTLSGPISDAVFPKLTQIVAQKAGLAVIGEFYHRSCQIVSIVAIPLSLTIATFSHDILLLWLGDGDLARRAAFPTSVLVLGGMLMAFQIIPFRLALAHGLTALTVKITTVLVILFLPSMFLATREFGIEGAASAWLGYNVFALFPLAFLLHRLVLPGASSRWFWADVCLPLVAVSVVVLSAKLASPSAEVGLYRISQLAGVWIIATLVALICLPSGRAILSEIVGRIIRQVPKREGHDG